MDGHPAGAPPIEVADVTKIYAGTVRALDAVRFQIAWGQRACLLGPNGAGKTTLIRLLTGALQPTSGSARLFGAAAHERGFLAAKRRVGIVPQQPGMYRDLTVREYLAFVQRLYARGDVAEVLDAFGLSAFAERPLAALSGGYQRRLALAAAVLPQPDLLLLDEPTVGLDPLAAREIRDYLARLLAGRTVLLCTHNLAEAEQLCESVVILRGGRVLVHEPLAALRQRAMPLVVFRARQGPEALAAALRALGQTPQQDGADLRVALASPERDAPEILRALLGQGLDVYECHVETPSLEEVFLSLLGAEDAVA